MFPVGWASYNATLENTRGKFASPEIADRLLSELDNTTSPIADNPHAWREVRLFSKSSLVAMNVFFVNAQNFLSDLPAAAALNRSGRSGDLSLC